MEGKDNDTYKFEFHVKPCNNGKLVTTMSTVSFKHNASCVSKWIWGSSAIIIKIKARLWVLMKCESLVMFELYLRENND